MGQVKAEQIKPVDSAEPRPLSKVEQTTASLARVGVPKDAMPRHIAVIMDGNGRWADGQNQPRIYGHERGAEAVRDIVTECARLELDALTLYSFSTENWSRPAEEIDFLMGLYGTYLIAERPTMMANDVRLVQIGRREGLGKAVLKELDETVRLTAGNKGLTLALAINYGSHAEITDAVRAIAQKVRAGRMDPDGITEQTISDHLYTVGLPDPDLLVRTAGEMRISNYLLWQISYAEIYISDLCWPEFTIDELHKAIRTFVRRVRKFGGVAE